GWNFRKGKASKTTASSILRGVRFGSKADICSAIADVRFGPRADIYRSARPAPKCARLLLQIFSFVRYGVEELRDLLVHELNVGSFRRRYGEVALKRWDHDVLRARNMSRVVRGFRRRIVKIARSIHENCFCLDALECLDGVAIKSRRRTDIVTII